MNFIEGVGIFGDIITGKKSTNTPNNRLINKSYGCDENTSIYNSNRIKKGLHTNQIKAEKRKALARDPVRSGLISRNVRNRGSNRKSVINNKSDNIEHFGNVSADSEFSDNSSMASSQSVVSLSNDPNLLINQSNKFLDNRFHERKFQNPNFNDSYANQYEPSKFDMKDAPSSFNAVHRSDSGVSRLQAERTLAMKDGYSNFGESKDLTYGVVSEDKFVHNNMIPQFKSATYGSDMLNATSRNSIAQRKMEAFTGNLDGIKITKTEQKPLFSPLIGITNIYGMPSVTNMLEDRYTPGRERKNELPFKQQRVTTGLNLGYNEVNKNGDNFRPMPKTIDEMRTMDNKQKSYTFSQVSGMKGTRGPVIGETKKYKPERTKYWGDDRLVPSLGYIRAPAIYGEFNKDNMATINRGMTERTLVGPAQSEVQQSTPDTVREKYKVDFKQNYQQAEPRNIMLVEGLQAREDSKKYIPDPTQRSQTQNYIGPIGTSDVTKGKAFDVIANIFDLTKRNLTENTDRYGASIGGDFGKTAVENFTDVADPTMRTVHNQLDRYGLATIGDYAKPVFYNPNDVTKTTMRNIHDKYDRHGVQFKDEFDKGYVINYDLATPDITMRNVHDRLDRAGNINSDRTNSYVINYDLSTPDITMRNIHDKSDRAGMGTSDRNNSYVINYDLATPDITMRNIHDKSDRAGVGQSDRNNSYVINYDLATPDINMRNIHDKNDRAGVGQSDRNNSYVINYDLATPDINMRNIHDKNDRVGTVVTGERQNSYAIDYNLATPDINMRNIHEKTDRSGVVTGDQNKSYVVNHIDYAPGMTMRDIHDKTDRSGLLTGDQNKGYTVNYINYAPGMTMRDIHDKTDRAGLLTGDQNKSYSIDYVNHTPDVTMREIHSKLDRSAAGANGVILAGRTRDDANNSHVNITREVIAKGRAPTNSKYSKGPTMDYTTVSLCEPIQIKRDLLSSTIAINEKLPFMLTQTPTGRSVTNTRINEFTQKVLNENPFINNVVYKSVPID